MRFLLFHDGLFWTGTRFSPHIAEALKLSKPAARLLARQLSQAMRIIVETVEA